MEAAAKGFSSNVVTSDRQSFPSSDANTFCQTKEENAKTNACETGGKEGVYL
jgi:hypothetical protein